MLRREILEKSRNNGRILISRLGQVETAIQKSGTDFDDWVLLGYSNSGVLALEKKLGSSKLMDRLHTRIRIKSDELRRPFLEYLAETTRCNSSVAWNISEVAESNSLCSNLFLDFCYLSIGKELLRTQKGRILIVVESETLYDELKKICLENGTTTDVVFVHGTATLLNILGRVAALVGFIRSVLGSLRTVLVRRAITLWYLGRIRREDFSANTLLVHTFANDACFDPSGVYKERYFGELLGLAEREGFRLMLLLHTGYCDRPFREIVQWCRQSKGPFVFVEQGVTLIDIILSNFVSLGLARTVLPKRSIDGIGISGLLKAEISKHILGGNLRGSYLYYAFAKNLAKKNIRLKYALDIYEGHLLERALRYSLHTYMHGCTAVGFCHAGFGRNYLSQYNLSNIHESDCGADFILCTGEGYKQVLVAEGFKRDRIIVVGDLRIANHKVAKEETPRYKKWNRIVVALPLVLNDAQEITSKVLNSLDGFPAKVTLHKHPMMSTRDLMSGWSRDLPQNVEFSDEPTPVALGSCDLVVTTASNVSALALRYGIPVITVVRTVGLTLEPLDWFETPISYCHSAEDIRKEAHRLVSLSVTERAEYYERGRKIVDACFEPTNTAAIGQFLDILRKVPVRGTMRRTEDEGR